jgi:hypothetical protein
LAKPSHSERLGSLRSVEKKKGPDIIVYLKETMKEKEECKGSREKKKEREKESTLKHTTSVNKRCTVVGGLFSLLTCSIIHQNTHSIPPSFLTALPLSSFLFYPFPLDYLGSWQMFFPYPSTKENGDFNNLCC